VLPVRSDDTITAILPVSEFTEEEYLILATKHGWIKKTPLAAFEKLSSRGLTIASLGDGDSLNWCHRCRDGDSVLLGSTMGLAIRYEVNLLRKTGRTSRGVRAMKLKAGDEIADMNVLEGGTGEDQISSSEKKDEEFILAVTSNGFGKRVATSEFKIQARGGIGKIAIKFKKKKRDSQDDDRVSCLLAAKEDDEVLVITAKGIMVRQKVSDIPIQSRTATGVMIQRLNEGDQISSVSIVPTYEERDA
jgi:DNA gyrase subunit A